MRLVHEPSVEVHKVVLFDEYLYSIGLRIGGVRKVTVYNTGRDLKSVASVLYDSLAESLKAKLSPHQTKLLGSIMREGEKCLNVN